jgi:RNA polymerase sigma-70 factor (ECF subfamily)
MTDEPARVLLERFVRGDRDAFEFLFRGFERDVHAWILRIVRDRSAADDAVVEAFWRAYRSRARFDPGRSFGAWMRRIATNAALDQLKANRARAHVSLGDADGATAAGTDAIARDRIVRAFAALPPRLRLVATLALVEQEPLSEIADALDVPVGTVKSRLFRATRLLRASLAGLRERV